MIPKLCLFFLTVIHISAAMEFQSLLPSSFSQNLFHPPSDTGKGVKNAVGVRRHEIRLEKQEELLEKQEARLGQLNDALKAQGKLNEVQDQLLSTMQASQLDEKSRLSTIEEKLLQLEDKLVIAENASKRQSDGNPKFYVGLKKASGQKVHHWSTGKKPDENLWCKGPGKKHSCRCAILGTKRRKGYCLIGSRCKVKRYAICENPL